MVTRQKGSWCVMADGKNAAATAPNTRIQMEGRGYLRKDHANLIELAMIGFLEQFAARGYFRFHFVKEMPPPPKVTSAFTVVAADTGSLEIVVSMALIQGYTRNRSSQSEYYLFYLIPQPESTNAKNIFEEYLRARGKALLTQSR